MTNYVRVKLTNQIRYPFWAIKKEQGEFIKYVKVNREGEWGLDNKLRIVVVTKDDIAWEKPAKMNLHYGELEVIKDA